jgi:SsrA-binding protein
LKSKKQANKFGDDGYKLIAANKKAHFDYFITDKMEVGIALVGSELRPCREGRVSLKDSFVDEIDGQFWLYDVHIGSNAFSNRNDHEPERKRRLLAHKVDIIKWGHKANASGMTIVPLKMYFKRGKVKVEIGLAKGKALYDKRDSLAKKDAKRDVERALGGKW